MKHRRQCHQSIHVVDPEGPTLITEAVCALVARACTGHTKANRMQRSNDLQSNPTLNQVQPQSEALALIFVS